jgi:hypothetical protein
MHLREPAPAPSQLRPGIPPEIDQLVLRCLAKDPAQRFPTAGELAIAIGGLIGSSPQVPTARARSYPPAAAPTTLSGATGASSTPHARRSRVGLIATIVGLGAAGLAIVIVTTHSGDQRAPTPDPLPVSAADRPPAPAPLPAPAPARPPPPAPASPPAPPDPGARVAPVIKDALARFAAWSRDHVGAPCPDAVVLGASDDPWGHRPVITCTEQPGDQIVGAISAGPDGQPGTADDIASWQLGRDVTDLVRGARWRVVSQRPVTRPAAPAKPRPSALAPAKPASVPTKPAPADASTKPAPADVPAKSVPAKPAPAVQLDESGMPITR